METLSLDIQGMSCNNCVKHVQKALTGLNDVEVQDVTIGHATVKYDAAHIAKDKIIDAVNDEGYVATVAG
jgi:copper chaperone CopZ